MLYPVILVLSLLLGQDSSAEKVACACHVSCRLIADEDLVGLIRDSETHARAITRSSGLRPLPRAGMDEVIPERLHRRIIPPPSARFGAVRAMGSIRVMGCRNV